MVERYRIVGATVVISPGCRQISGVAACRVGASNAHRSVIGDYSETMHIDIWSDVACPWCYLGVRHLRQALREFPHRDDVTVRLHAYLLQPDLDGADPRSEADYLADTKNMARADVDAALESLSVLGQKEGIAFRWDEVVVASTTNAHRLIALAREYDIEGDTTTGGDTLEMRVHEALQRARFEVGVNLADVESLIRIGEEYGMDGHRLLATFEDQDSASAVFSDFQIGVQIGVNAVPVFLFDNRFVVEGAQPTAAFAHILRTAWAETTKDSE